MSPISNGNPSGDLPICTLMIINRNESFFFTFPPCQNKLRKRLAISSLPRFQLISISGETFLAIIHFGIIRKVNGYNESHGQSTEHVFSMISSYSETHIQTNHVMGYPDICSLSIHQEYSSSMFNYDNVTFAIPDIG